MTDEWTPQHDDIIWLMTVLEMLNEGGILSYPNTGLIYKVSHRNKTLTLQNPARLAEPNSRKLHEMTAIIAGFFYYEVREAVQ